MNPVTTSVIEYPSCDGLPLADNTEQLKWIVIFFTNLSAMFRDREDVFVASDLLWYPEKGNDRDRLAPDVMLAFGRPKGYRSSYLQWDEGDIAPQVVFEILSPSNRDAAMGEKRTKYEEWGVEEYYIFDPLKNTLAIFVRKGEVFLRQRKLAEYVSRRMGIRFELSGKTLLIFRPDGSPFRTYDELEVDNELQRRQRLEAEQIAETERFQRLEAERKQAVAERKQAVAEEQRIAAEQQIETQSQELLAAERRFARLRELSRKARLHQATADELAELERLDQDL